MRATYILTALLATVSLQAFSKESKDELKANYLYNHLAYHEAIPYYEKIADQQNSAVTYAQLGDCYRLTKNPKQAAAEYAKAVKIAGCANEVKLHYGEVLMTLEKYDEAEKWLKQYQTANPGEKRVANLITSCEQAPDMLKGMPDASVLFMPFNTNGSDFGPAIRQGMVVFTSDTVIDVHKKKDDWTGAPYYTMYSVTSDKDGHSTNDLKKIATARTINVKYHDGPCSFSADGNQMYFTRTNVKQQFLMTGGMPDHQGNVHLEIMVASGYNQADRSFKNITPFPYNDKNYSTAHPSVSPSGNILAFTSDMPGGIGGSDIYICKKDEKGNWGKPQNAGAMINTEGEELSPLLADDNTLYFASDGHVGLGGLDIYVAKWDNATGSYGMPENLGTPVNSPYDDMSIALYADNDGIGYFASNRPAAKDGDNIYYFKKQKVSLDIKVVDAGTNQPLSGSTIALDANGVKRSFTTNENGELMTRLLPQAQYSVSVARMGYAPQTMNVSTFDSKNNDVIQKTVYLHPDFRINYTAVVLDEKTKQPIETPTVVFERSGGEGIDSTQLQTGETFSRELKPDASYHIYAVKRDYYSNEKVISTKGITPSAGGVNFEDTLYMKKLEVGEVYKIENIYYDFNKANIREDAKPSLERLIVLLNQYPQMHIQVNSHTDCRGSDAYNMKLSNARARAVIEYLKQRGISTSRLQSKGYGERKPVDKCECSKCTEMQYQNNRRTEFQIISM